MRALVLSSGGVDSTTCLGMAVDKYGKENVVSLSVFYGQKHTKELEKTDGKPVSTYVPFRNGLFLATAASIALSKKCDVIYYGAHADDAAGNAYPDCSEAFYNAMNTAVYEGSGRQLKIEAPLVTWNKATVVKKGLELKVPYELTWSCYEGGDKPCMKCGTCIDRMKAFEANNVKDPVLGE